MTNIKTALGHRIRFLRNTANLTQEQLAEKSGLSGKFIGEIERGTGNPTIETLDMIAKALEVPVTELLAEEDEDQIFSKLSKQDLLSIRKALQILERIFLFAQMTVGMLQPIVIKSECSQWLASIMKYMIF